MSTQLRITGGDISDLVEPEDRENLEFLGHVEISEIYNPIMVGGPEASYLINGESIDKALNTEKGLTSKHRGASGATIRLLSSVLKNNGLFLARANFSYTEKDDFYRSIGPDIRRLGFADLYKKNKFLGFGSLDESKD